MLQELTKSKSTPQVLMALDEPIKSVTKAASDWYLERVNEGRKRKFGTVEVITPDKAEMLLQVNPQNRNFNANRLAEIISDISRKNFECNGETVIVSRDGLLNDGQHRLTAVVQTGIGIETFIAWGVPRDSRTTVDTGTAKTAGNFIAMEGGTSGNLAASVSAWLIMHKRNIFEQTGNTACPTKSEVVANYFQNKDEIDSAIRFISKKQAKELRSNVPLAVCFLLMARVNRPVAEDFFTRLCEGAGYNIGSPLHRLRSRIMELQSARLRPGQKIGLIIRGWNAHRRGVAQTKTLQVPSEFPKIEN